MVPSDLTIHEVLQNETISETIPNSLLDLLLLFCNEEDWDEIVDYLNLMLSKSKYVFNSVSFIYLLSLLETAKKDFIKFNEDIEEYLASQPINYNL